MSKACPTPALLSVEVRLEATRVLCGSIMNLLNGLGVNGFHPEPEDWRAGMETGKTHCLLQEEEEREAKPPGVVRETQTLQIASSALRLVVI